jgi:hypothetical protein
MGSTTKFDGDRLRTKIGRLVNVACSRSDRMDGSDPVTDFACLPRAALERLARHYGVEAPSDCELPELATAVRDAFAREAVDEEQVMLSLLQRERRDAKRASSAVHHKRAREMTAKTMARSSHSGPHRSIEVSHTSRGRCRRQLASERGSTGCTCVLTRGQLLAHPACADPARGLVFPGPAACLYPQAMPRKKARGMTYGDMISSALRHLPGRRGTLEQIYEVLESKFGAQLNTELEAGPRQVRRSGLGAGMRRWCRAGWLACGELPCSAAGVDGVVVQGLGAGRCAGGGAGRHSERMLFFSRPRPKSWTMLDDATLAPSSPPQVPVWKASVRKITNLRFNRSNSTDAGMLSAAARQRTASVPGSSAGRARTLSRPIHSLFTADSQHYIRASLLDSRVTILLCRFPHARRWALHFRIGEEHRVIAYWRPPRDGTCTLLSCPRASVLNTGELWPARGSLNPVRFRPGLVPLWFDSWDAVG